LNIKKPKKNSSATKRKEPDVGKRNISGGMVKRG
jgi:hypothetical protein